MCHYLNFAPINFCGIDGLLCFSGILFCGEMYERIISDLLDPLHWGNLLEHLRYGTLLGVYVQVSHVQYFDLEKEV